MFINSRMINCGRPSRNVFWDGRLFKLQPETYCQICLLRVTCPSCFVHGYNASMDKIKSRQSLYTFQEPMKIHKNLKQTIVTEKPSKIIYKRSRVNYFYKYQT